MAEDVVMPRLSDSMEEGTIVAWLKSVGERVEVGDDLVEIATDKADTVYAADLAGTLLEILVRDGETAPLGETIARIGEPGEPTSNGGPPDERSVDEPVAEASTPAPADATSAAAIGSSRVNASPLARRIARARGIDLSTIRGSGPRERIIKADVERAVARRGSAIAASGGGKIGTRALEHVSAPAPGPGETAKGRIERDALSRVQQIVAQRMSESKATAPHFYLQSEIDMSRCVAGRAELKAASREGDVVPSFNDMVVKASAIALVEHPRANASYRDGALERYSRINVGVAVAAGDALVVPTIFDADRKSLREIANETRTAAERVRDGSITPGELSGGTFTVSNLGMYDVQNFGAVINPQQAAILAVGAIVERPVVRNGEVTIAHLMGVTLVCDHRILYGAQAASFLKRVRGLLEQPLGLA